MPGTPCNGAASARRARNALRRGFEGPPRRRRLPVACAPAVNVQVQGLAGALALPTVKLQVKASFSVK